MSTKKPVVIGLGNTFRGDDKLGISVIKTLKEEYPDLADYYIEQGDPTRLADLWDRRNTIIVDAVKAPDNTLEIFEIHSLRELRREYVRFSTHSIDLKEALMLCDILHEQPKSIYIIGVRGSSWEVGDEISPEVQSKIPDVIEKIIQYIRRLNEESSHSIA